MRDKSLLIPAVLVCLCFTAPFSRAQNENQGQGRAIVTALPRNDKQPTADVSQQAIRIEVNGKRTPVTNWQPLRGSASDIELVIDRKSVV